MWEEELKPGFAEATTKLKSKRNEIEKEENFKIKGSILFNAVGIIEDVWTFGGIGGIWGSVGNCLGVGHAFYSKRIIIEKLENAENILRKYDAIRLRMNSYLSPLGVEKLPSLEGLIKDIQNSISHLRSSNSWKYLINCMLKESNKLYKLMKGDKENALKDDMLLMGFPIAYRLINIGFDIYDLMDGKMCDEANVLENIIMKIQSDHENLEKVLFQK